ncbi:MAG: alanine racemase [Clostridia bacterium]
MKRRPDRVWVEINLDHIRHNFNEIRKKIGPDVKINAIIKADGYGHGAVETARILGENCADMLSVATLDEAIQLRRKNIRTPLLVLGYILRDRIREITENDIVISIFDRDMAEGFSRKALELGTRIKVHIKIDTGMNRVGFHYSKPEDIQAAFRLEGLHIEGIFTHFSTADEEDTTYTDLQFKRFQSLLKGIEGSGHPAMLKHACNSGGVLLHPDKYLDMVRPGLILFGLYPSEHAEKNSGLDLKKAMVFKSRVIESKEVEAGQPVSYGGKYVTWRKTRIATIACGYADGYSRLLSGKASVMINGSCCPVIGNICMDMCMIDITDAEKHIRAGDEVVLFDGEITIDQLAKTCNTLNYEFVCKIGMRVPRVYLKGNKVHKVSNYLLK